MSVEKIPISLRAVVVGIVVAVLVSALTLVIQWYAGFAWGPRWTECTDFWFMGAWVGTIVPMFLGLFPKKIRFTAAEMAVVYSCAYTVAWTSWGYGLYKYMVAPYGATLLSPAVYERFSQVFPSFAWIGDQAIATNVVLGGQAIPSVYYPYMVFWTSMMVVSFIYFFLLGTMLRKQYVEEENLAFPLSHWATEMIGSSTVLEEKSVPILRQKWLWIAIGITFVWGILERLDIIATAFRITGLQPIQLQYDLTTLGTSNAVLYVALAPPWIGFAVFQPLDITFTAFFTGLMFFYIIPVVATATGMFPAPTPQVFADAMWQNLTANYGGGMRSLGWSLLPIWTALQFGLPIWALLVHRKTVLNTLKAVVGKAPVGFEDNEPIPYRYQFLGMVVCGLIWLGMIMALGAGPLAAFLVIFYATFLYWGYARIRAESGGNMGQLQRGAWYWNPGNSWVSLTFGFQNNQVQEYAFGTVFAMYSSDWAFGTCAFTNNPTMQILECYKVGHNTKSSNKAIFLGSLISIVLAIVITMTLGLWGYYAIGTSHMNGVYTTSAVLGGFNPWIADLHWSLSPVIGWGYLQWGNEWTWSWFAFGVIVIPVLHYARRKWPRLPLNAVGILLGIVGGPIIMLNYVIGMILKLIVLKIGGATLMRKTLLPLSTGFIAGWALVYGFLGLIALLSGQFYPH